MSNVRVAEGKDTENNKFEEARDIVDSLKTLLPMFNLSNTENLSVSRLAHDNDNDNFCWKLSFLGSEVQNWRALCHSLRLSD